MVASLAGGRNTVKLEPCPTELFHDLPCYRQAQAAPRGPGLCGSRSPEEPFENVPDLIGGYADTGVLHIDLRAVSLAAQPDSRAALDGVLECVAHQVGDHPAEKLVITLDRYSLENLRFQPETLLGGHRRECLDGLRDHGFEVHGVPVDYDATRLESSEDEQVVHELLEPHDVGVDDSRKLGLHVWYLACIPLGNEVAARFHRGQWGPEFVCDDRDHRIFEALHFFLMGHVGKDLDSPHGTALVHISEPTRLGMISY